MVTVDEITRTIAAAAETGAACLVAEVTDTIKLVDNGFIRRTVDRSALRRALTPQAFEAGLLRRAFENADIGDAVTDECCLVENLDVDIVCVEGDPRNLKITRVDDIRSAESFVTGNDV